jgi:hypothetical protein
LEREKVEGEGRGGLGAMVLHVVQPVRVGLAADPSA